MPTGFFTLESATDLQGRKIPARELVRRGVANKGRRPRGWGITDEEVPLGKNLFLDQGRQYLAFAFTFRAPIGSFVIQNFGVGTGTTPPTVADVSLENPILLSNGQYTKPIDGVDYPSPFIARIRFTLGANDANGYAVTEWGIFSGDGTLLIRTTLPVLNKTPDYTPTFSYRLRC